MKKIYVGIDIGGSTIRGVLINDRLRILRQAYISIPKSKSDFLRALTKFIEVLKGNAKIAGIGIGVPGVMDVKRGVLTKAPNAPFLNAWNVNRSLSRFRVPVKSDLDCRCFLISESIIGAGQKYKNVIAIAIGTGIGTGIIINRTMYRGSHNASGEFGHTILDNKKTFEQLAAKKAFLREGDRSKVIGVGIANIVNALDPDIVIIGGGGGLSKHVRLETIRKTAKQHIMYPVAQKTPIVKSKLGEFAQAIGAALLFRKDLSD